MNVLLLNHIEADYGAAFLHAGLCSVLGAENIYDYPVKRSYHGETDLDYSVPENNVHGNGCTAPLPWDKGVPCLTADWNDNLVSDLIAQGFFNLVVLESARPWVRKSWAKFGEQIRAAGIPVVLHNGEDHPGVNSDFAPFVEPDLYLVRERWRGHSFDEKQGKTWIIPFPFSAPDCLIRPLSERPQAFDWEVSCLLGMSHPNRKSVADALRASNQPGVYVATSDPPQEALGSLPQHPLLSWENYISHLRRSRFGVSVRGYGWDTCRYWEVAAVTGLLADELDIHIPFPFENGVNCYTYRPSDDVAETAEYIVRNTASAEEIAEMGMIHCAKHHTNSARVRWMLEHLEGRVSL